MRVLYLSASGELGGGETSLLDLLASLRRARPAWSLHLLAAAEGPLTRRAAALHVGTSVVPFPESMARIGEAGVAADWTGTLRLGWRVASASGPLAAYAGSLRRVVAGLEPDLVHTNSLKMHVLGSLVRPRSAALVWHLHDYIGSRPFTARLLRWTAGRPAAIIATSASVAADARGALPAGVTIVTLPNGVDLQRFSASGSRLDLDALSGLPPAGNGVVRVGLLGAFARWKGHATFLKALSRLPRDLPVRAYVVGGPLYQTDRSQYTLDELRDLAASLGLAGRIGFTGFVGEPESAIRALDVVVHASTAPEPFGLVIVEAMACGRAVIASQAGGAEEIITPGVDALGHPPGNVEELASCIARLATDHELRARLGRAGRRTAELRFDRARLAADLLPIYESALARA
jgi:glycosyltransferase involved in cell wall biosynthesis